jgi:hypothetical protein
MSLMGGAFGSRTKHQNNSGAEALAKFRVCTTPNWWNSPTTFSSFHKCSMAAALTVQRPEVTGYNFTAPIATFGALGS